MAAVLQKQRPIDVTILVEQLKNLSKQQAQSQYEIAQITSSIRSGSLYTLLGYNSLKAFVKTELKDAMGPHAFTLYANLYDDFKSLKYTKTESLKILEQLPCYAVGRVLHKATKKLGLRALKNRVDAMENVKRRGQLNIWLGKEHVRVEKILARFGMKHGDHGRLGLGDSFLAFLDDYEKMDKARKSRNVGGT